PLTAAETGIQSARATELVDTVERLEQYVPESIEDAKQTLSIAASMGSGVERTEDSATFMGEEVPVESAEKLNSFVDKGLQNYRLNAAGRKEWSSAANALHPTELSKPLRERMNSLKTDPNEPSSRVFNLIKAEASRRLSLDEAVAAEQ